MHELAYLLGIGHWTMTANEAVQTEPFLLRGEEYTTIASVSTTPEREEFDVDFYLENIRESEHEIDIDLELTHELLHVLFDEAVMEQEAVIHRLAKLLISLGFAEEHEPA